MNRPTAVTAGRAHLEDGSGLLVWAARSAFSCSAFATIERTSA